MIKDTKPLSLIEVRELITDKEEEKKELNVFVKRFAKLDLKDAKKLREELENSGIIRIKAEHIAKIIDFLPEDVSDVNKIFVDTSLEENEINKIIEIVKKYR